MPFWTWIHVYIPELRELLTVDWKEAAFKGILTTGTAGQVAAFWDCFVVAVFGYVGIETLAITAWETECPRRSIPQAVRRVSSRIIIYYISVVFISGLTVSSNDPLLLLPTTPNPQAPGRIYPGAFIIMAERAGLPAVAHIINAVMVLAVLSAATADIYVTVSPLTYEIDSAESMFICNGFSWIHWE
jgi:amino acid permease